MFLPRRLLPLALLTFACSAHAASFEFPQRLDGFTGRPMHNALTPGGPIDRVLRQEDTTCDRVGVYTYRDGQAATAGLSGWLAEQRLTPKEFARTSQAVVWGASTKRMELVGTWVAPRGEEEGRLEMCERDLVTEQRVQIPVGLIALLLGGVGTLGSAGGRMFSRWRGARQAS